MKAIKETYDRKVDSNRVVALADQVLSNSNADDYVTGQALPLPRTSKNEKNPDRFSGRYNI